MKVYIRIINVSIYTTFYYFMFVRQICIFKYLLCIPKHHDTESNERYFPGNIFSSSNLFFIRQQLVNSILWSSQFIYDMDGTYKLMHHKLFKRDNKESTRCQLIIKVPRKICIHSQVLKTKQIKRKVVLVTPH